MSTRMHATARRVRSVTDRRSGRPFLLIRSRAGHARRVRMRETAMMVNTYAVNLIPHTMMKRSPAWRRRRVTRDPSGSVMSGIISLIPFILFPTREEHHASGDGTSWYRHGFPWDTEGLWHGLRYRDWETRCSQPCRLLLITTGHGSS